MLFTVPDLPLAGLILQQFYRLGNNPINNKTIKFLSLQHAPSFVFQLIIDKNLRQDESINQIRLERTQEDIDANLTALKVSQENQCQAAAQDSIMSFSYHGLQSSKQKAAVQAASSSGVASSSGDALSSGVVWSSPEDTWPSTEDTWPSAEDTWPSAEAAGAVFSHHALPTNTLPTNTLPTNVEEKGKIFNHYNDFFAACASHQEEMLKVELP